MIDLKLAKYILPDADSQAGLGFLEYYSGHKVYHPGYDLNRGRGNEDLGAKLYSPARGVVQYVSSAKHNAGLGLYVVINHMALNRKTRWMHLKSTPLQIGDKIEFGSFIGELGNSGTRYAHLHFEVWKPGIFNSMRTHWRPYGMYPSKWPKWRVAENFEDPAKFIQDSLDFEKKLNSKKLEPKKNVVEIYLYREEKSGKIYLIRDGKYYHVKDEPTFASLFGRMKEDMWVNGPKINKDHYGGSLKLTKYAKKKNK